MLSVTCCKRLGEIVGEGNLTLSPVLNGRWPGAPPKSIVRPADREQVCEVLRFAYAERLSVAAAGSMTKQRLGGPPRETDILLSLERLNRITDYQAADLTVSVHAGVRMTELAAALRRENQMLPLDPPFGAEATIGGVLATNGSGPRRLAYGAARDMVLGMHFVTADGRLAKSGGKVVKNVAGYDVAKLLIGSLGTLGIIMDVTCKAFPIPPASATLLCGFESAAQALSAARRILHSPFAPQALDLLDREAWSLLPEASLAGAAYVLAVGTAGPGPVVERMARDIPALVQSDHPADMARIAGQEESNLWSRIQELTPSFLQARAEGVVIKSSVVITAVEEAVTSARLAALDAGLACATLARAGSGIVYSYIWPETAAPDTLVHCCDLLVRQTEQAGGRAIVEWAPENVKQRTNIWGAQRDDFPLMRGLKAEFDPYGILNPGRFYGGI